MKYTQGTSSQQYHPTILNNNETIYGNPFGVETTIPNSPEETLKSQPRYENSINQNSSLTVDSYKSYADVGAIQQPVTYHRRRRSSLPYDFAPPSRGPSDNPMPTREQREYWMEDFGTFLKGTAGATTQQTEEETIAPPVRAVDPFEENLYKLWDIGFRDSDKNTRLLLEYNNNITTVIEILLEEQKEEQRSKEKPKEEIKETKAVGKAETATKSTTVDREKKYFIRLVKYRDLVCTVNIMGEDNKLLYEARLSLFYSISLSDKNGRKLLTIIKDSLHIHPTYDVYFNGSLVAQCKERFKMSRETRKFNYKLASGTELKMIGTYGRDWVIKRNGKIVANVVGQLKGANDLTIKPTTVGALHFLAMVMIMMERKYTSLRSFVI